MKLNWLLVSITLTGMLLFNGCSCESERIPELKRDVEYARRQAIAAQKARRRIERESKRERATIRKELTVEQARRSWSDLYALGTAGVLGAAIWLLRGRTAKKKGRYV